jgi:hypothetical protein
MGHPIYGSLARHATVKIRNNSHMKAAAENESN